MYYETNNILLCKLTIFTNLSDWNEIEHANDYKTANAVNFIVRFAFLHSNRIEKIENALGFDETVKTNRISDANVWRWKEYKYLLCGAIKRLLSVILLVT